MTNTMVKQCPGCGAPLPLQKIRDCDEVHPLGMQVIGPDLKGSVFYFEHTRPGCGTTFVVSVLEFLPFITEAIPTDILTDTDRCEKYCLTLADLDECKQMCFYAPFRRLLIAMLGRCTPERSPTMSTEAQSPEHV